MFTINAAGCGKGKSTDNKAVITKNSNTRFLVIVPSLALAIEYAMLGAAITSDTTKNVKKQIYRAIDADTRVIIITQKAFLDFDRKALLCEHRTVLQDEHLEPFYMCKWHMDNHLQWLDMFDVAATDKEGWYSITLNSERAAEFIASSDMLDNTQIIEDLLVTPQLIYTNKPTMQQDSALFRVISPEIYAGADAVHIACSNFTVTRQYQLWATLFNTPFNVTKPFVPYATPNLTIHCAQQKRNSKTFNKHNTDIKDSVMAYIKAHCANPVYVDNNVYDDEGGWRRVQHNCHSVNEHRFESHIAVLSAINYDNLATAFLMDMGGMTAMQVRNALVGEIAHQVIMRGALREKNDNECQVYLMEAGLADYLTQCIFMGSTLTWIDGTNRPKCAAALTAVQRKKATLIRKNFPHLSESPTDKLMLDPIWQQTNTNGIYNKAYVKSMHGNSLLSMQGNAAAW